MFEIADRDLAQPPVSIEPHMPIIRKRSNFRLDSCVTPLTKYFCLRPKEFETR